MRIIRRLVILALIVGAGAWAIITLNQPAVGQVYQPAPAADPAAAASGQLANQTGRYASFQYPAAFQPRRLDPPTPPTLAAYSFSQSRPLGSWDLSVQINQLASGQLSDDGTYVFRQSSPGRFTRSTSSLAGQSVVTFNDNQSDSGFSQTAFISHGGLDSVITVSGSSADSQALSNLLNTIISHWQWQ